jgi:hypothetical protein
VCGFPSELEIAAGLQIETRTGRLQLPHSCWSLFDKHLDGLRVAESGSCRQRIATMQLG